MRWSRCCPYCPRRRRRDWRSSASRSSGRRSPTCSARRFRRAIALARASRCSRRCSESERTFAGCGARRYRHGSRTEDEHSMIEKIFKAYDVRATHPNPLNEEAAWKVGHATAQFLKRSRQNVAADARVKREDTVVVGRDMRPHSPDLAKALVDGIRSVGMNVVDVGRVDASVMYFAINH